MKLSIIIPMYNVELYIEKCLLSCLDQDIPQSDYEIIVVNDGSPDGSLAIAERVASTATNITVISQKNGGLSAARNTGLEVAKGEYVWFVDSDDWIEKDCLGRLTTLLTGVDCIRIGFRKVWNNHQEESRSAEAKSGKELLRNGIQQPVQFYIMKREFLKVNKLKFMEGIFHEDMEFTPRMLYLADEVFCMQDYIYNYLQRENSIMTTPNPKRAFDLIKVIESLHDFNQEFVDNDTKPVFYNSISLGINNALCIISKADQKDQIRWIAIIKEKKQILSSLKKSTYRKYQLEGLLFSLFGYHRMIKQYLFLQKLK